MSTHPPGAADKLRDLHALLDPESGVRRSLADQVRSIDSLAAALPDIIAVIAAAEQYLGADLWIDGHPHHGPSIFNEVRSAATTSECLRDALAALHARLTDSDGGEA